HLVERGGHPPPARALRPPVLHAADRRVEVLQLEDPVQAAHRSARVADAARYTSVSCSPCGSSRSPRDLRENRAGGGAAGRTPPSERIRPDTRRPSASRSAAGAYGLR